MHSMVAHDFRRGPPNNQCGRFVNADTQQLRMSPDDRNQIGLATALCKVLIDGSAWQKGKPALVTFGHHHRITEWVAPHKELPLNGGSG